METTDHSTTAPLIPIEDRLLTRLPPEAAAARLMELPARRRLELLQERPDAAAVVAALPEQDFYLFLRELGEYDAAPLLSLARPAQFTHLLDMEGWRGDEVQGGRALVWCSRLAEANLAGLFTWALDADPELLFLFFRHWVEVLPFPEDEEDETEAMDRVPSLTIDGQFYFLIRYPDQEQTVRLLLQALFEEARSRYLELMHLLQQGMETEMAELAYRFHRGRLEDLAIPVLAEATGIYHPLRSGQALSKKGVSQVEDLRAPSFALALAPREGLLAAALAGLSEAALTGVRMELAALANKVVVADALAPEEPESLRQAVAKVCAFVELGLAGVSAGEVGPATLMLQGLFVEDLFRLGFTGMAGVAARLSLLMREGWLREWPHGLAILEQEWEERASLLTGPTPMILRPAPVPGGEAREDYPRTLADLEEAGELVAMLEALAPVYTALRADWPAGWEELAGRLWSDSQAGTLAAVTLGALCCTAAARRLWQGQWRALPLAVASWPEILPLLAPEALWGAVEPRLRELQSSEQGYQRVLRYLRPLFARYAAEMGALDPQQVPDPRHVPFFLFTTSAD